MKPVICSLIVLFLLTSCSTLNATPSPDLMLDGQPVFLQVISVENASQMQVLRTLEIPEYKRRANCQCTPAFSPDGSKVAAACGKNPIPVWDVASGELLFSLESTTQTVACTFSPNGAMLACGGFDEKITFWDIASGTKIKEIAEVNSPIWEAAFSPDGSHLAVCGLDSGVSLWDVETGNQVWSAEPVTRCLSLAFDPSGSVIAFGGLYGEVDLLNAEDGTSLGLLTDLYAPVADMAFNSTGTQLVAACDNFKIYLWNMDEVSSIEHYNLQASLEGNKGYVNGVAFSPDDTLFLSAGHDFSLRLWDSTSLENLAIFKEHTSPVLRGVFNPQGTLIATVSWDGTLKLWGVEK